MSKAEIYFPETIATQTKNSEGKISFTLDYAKDFIQSNDLYNFGTLNIKKNATKLYINSSDVFPSLSDPSGNYATHYLVILLDANNKYVAIPICNNYQENFIKHVNQEYLEKTLTRSIDKLLKIARSNIQDAKILIDLNSTMNELKGTPTSYKKYTSKFNETDKADSEIYVIDKIIYVEPFIKTSFYEQIITKKIYGLPDKGTYLIANVTAECKSTGGSSSPLFDIGKDPDELSTFLYFNVSLTLFYIIFLFVFYKIEKTYLRLFLLAILSIPITIYLSIYKNAKNAKLKTTSKTDALKYSFLSMVYSTTILISMFLFWNYNNPWKIFKAIKVFFLWIWNFVMVFIKLLIDLFKGTITISNAIMSIMNNNKDFIEYAILISNIAF